MKKLSGNVANGARNRYVHFGDELHSHMYAENCKGIFSIALISNIEGVGTWQRLGCCNSYLNNVKDQSLFPWTHFWGTLGNTSIL